MSDIIFIREARFQCHLGVTPKERATLQEVLLDVELTLDVAAAGLSDRIGDTVNYSEVWQRIHECIVPHEYRLVETLAEHVARTLLRGFPRVEDVSVRVTKPGALASRNAAAAGVLITRSRP
jgi:7,8-dihydroneopterin aldolase/epimerase/oxygenase